MQKKDVVLAAIEHVKERIRSIREELHDMIDGSADDIKSSSGDKHETDRAMTHLEMEKLGAQLDLERQILSTLEQIDLDRERKEIGTGSFVETNNGFFLLAAACGKIQVSDKTAFGISPLSPLGKLLMGKKPGEEIELNGKTYSIKSFN